MAIPIRSLVLPLASAICFTASAATTMILRAPAAESPPPGNLPAETVSVATEMSFPIFRGHAKIAYCVIGLDMPIAGEMARDHDFSLAYEQLYALAGATLANSTDSDTDCAALFENARQALVATSWQVLALGVE
jgi:hypothetical protein